MRLPEATEPVNLLVVGLDQGSIGTAGHAFAEQEMLARVHAKWDISSSRSRRKARSPARRRGLVPEGPILIQLPLGR